MKYCLILSVSLALAGCAPLIQYDQFKNQTVIHRRVILSAFAEATFLYICPGNSTCRPNDILMTITRYTSWQYTDGDSVRFISGSTRKSYLMDHEINYYRSTGIQENAQIIIPINDFFELINNSELIFQAGSEEFRINTAKLKDLVTL